MTMGRGGKAPAAKAISEFDLNNADPFGTLIFADFSDRKISLIGKSNLGCVSNHSEIA
jgi:hypothetical protein